MATSATLCLARVGPCMESSSVEKGRKKARGRADCDGWCESIVREGPLCEPVRQGLVETQVEDGAHRVGDRAQCRALLVEWAGVQELQAA